MFRRVNIGRSVERDIIWNSHGAQILSAVFKIRRSIFPLDKAFTMIPQRSFSRSIRIYTWMKYSTMIIRSTTRFEMSFRSFCFCFLSLFFSFYFLNRGKQENDRFNRNHGRCVHGMPRFRSVSRKRRCTSIHPVFEHFFEFDDRDSYPGLFIATVATRPAMLFLLGFHQLRWLHACHESLAASERGSIWR